MPSFGSLGRAMKPGVLIDYRIRVHGLPIRWRTEITEWNPPHRFVDVQLHGPYTLWPGCVMRGLNRPWFPHLLLS